MIRDSVKSRITQAVLDQLPEQSQLDLTIAAKSWWVNIRNDGGLRLTEVGKLYFALAEIEYFDLPLDYKKSITKNQTTWNAFLMELNHKLTCPYYLGKNIAGGAHIRLYDSKVAMMISLYGDVYDYVKSTKRRK